MDEVRELLKEVAENIISSLETKEKAKFHDGSVPVKVAARVMGRDATWIRAGIIAGWLPIGVATRDGKQITDVKDTDSKHGRINYFISPKQFYEYTGYIWKGEEA